MLTVGVDSYVTLEEADTFIKNNMLSSDETLQKWVTLEDNDKEVLLRNSCRDINALKFDGRRQVPGQLLEFPRVTATVSGIGVRLFYGQFYDNGLYSGGSSIDGGLEAVKQAQVINAAYAGLYNDIAVTQVGLNIQGLTSKKAGPIQETYSHNNSDTTDALMGIYTKKVYSILRPWLNDARISI